MSAQSFLEKPPFNRPVGCFIPTAMSEVQIKRFLQRDASARYRKRIQEQQAEETITWFPIPGPNIPDDELTILLQYPEAGVYITYYGYRLAGRWFNVHNHQVHPIAWANTPSGISLHRHKLMIHAQHTSRPRKSDRSK